jgi:hypothetical protein
VWAAAWDWATIANVFVAITTGGLAVVTFLAQRTSNRTARAAELQAEATQQLVEATSRSLAMDEKEFELAQQRLDATAYPMLEAVEWRNFKDAVEIETVLDGPVRVSVEIRNCGHASALLREPSCTSEWSHLALDCPGEIPAGEARSVAILMDPSAFDNLEAGSLARITLPYSGGPDARRVLRVELASQGTRRIAINGQTDQTTE